MIPMPTRNPWHAMRVAKQRVGKIARRWSNARLAKLGNTEAATADQHFDRMQELAGDIELRDTIKRMSDLELRQFIRNHDTVTPLWKKYLLRKSPKSMRAYLLMGAKEEAHATLRKSERAHAASKRALEKASRAQVRHTTGWIGTILSWLEK